ncbi:geranylgeranylglyceryl/heptaprenylglyceryl phosphate synthase [Candidatus Bathyarchaeota archaeon RBG_16_57_9]|nr:MAG: geranylgeranylglyceryl/heptaprenylglyceryl phosphate synthase [Candidatus Bathyarchaeota archaeon RBG_16_57_9]OGD53614.1 MAG: geranylgeranylglyceryl/heptaprenylglyceryl phosphate synthase [Candidatus Bathyarchaeota archaeon RBG_13_60_20]
MTGKVEKHLLKKIREDGCIHITLVDPDKSLGCDCATISREAEKGGTAAIMVGGSTLAAKEDLDAAVQEIKEKVKAPVILFPNGPMGVSRYADAIWFMSLLNSQNTYYIIDAHVISAPLVKRYGLEALPMGYIIVGEGCVAGYIGQARPISYRHPELAVGYGLAAETLGMRFVYLEAGSGARDPVPPLMVSTVKKHLGVPLIVGGGIRNPEAAAAASNAGADIIVTGTLVEEDSRVKEKIGAIVEAIKRKP